MQARLQERAEAAGLQLEAQRLALGRLENVVVQVALLADPAVDAAYLFLRGHTTADLSFDEHLRPGVVKFLAALVHAGQANYYRRIAAFAAAFVALEIESFDLE